MPFTNSARISLDQGTPMIFLPSVSPVAHDYGIIKLILHSQILANAICYKINRPSLDSF